MRTIAIGLVAIALFAGGARAQESEISSRGFSPEKVFNVGDVDAINLFNGNLTLTVPIGQRYPIAEHFSYGLTLVYNSLAGAAAGTSRRATIASTGSDTG